MSTLQNRLVLCVDEFRNLIKEYHLKTESEQKAIRHHLYTTSGKFGKEIKPLFESFKQIEDELVNKGKA